jgi:hypothetical protein
MQRDMPTNNKPTVIKQRAAFMFDIPGKVAFPGKNGEVV